MAFDAGMLAAVAAELREKLTGARVTKVQQPEKDEIDLVMHIDRENLRLLISASPSAPRIHLSTEQKENPITAPMFCMLLRKHLGGARLCEIEQPGFERVLRLVFDTVDEMGFPVRRSLICEIMGKYSNIIFCDEKGMILDSIKHVSSHMSSVREVLPGREYFIPNTRDKENPLTVSEEEFTQHICKKPVNISRALYTSLTGMSPVMAEEICYRASIDGSDAAQSLDEAACTHLYHTFLRLMEQIRNREFTPNIVYRGEEPVEYGVFPYQQFGSEYHSEIFDSVSTMLDESGVRALESRPERIS